MFSPLAYTVAIALFASLFLSILVIPVLCALVLRHGHEKESLVVRAVRRAVCSPPGTGRCDHRASTLVIAVVLVAVALLLVPHLGTEFVPIMDEGAFDMDVQMLPGISLDERHGDSRDRIEKKLRQFPELKTVVSRTGQTGLALEARGVDKTGFVGRPEAAVRLDQRANPGGAVRQDARRRGRHPRHRLQLQPADPVPHRRAGRRHARPGDRQAVRRRHGHPATENGRDRRGRRADRRRHRPGHGSRRGPALHHDPDRPQSDRPLRHQRQRRAQRRRDRRRRQGRLAGVRGESLLRPDRAVPGRETQIRWTPSATS